MEPDIRKKIQSKARYCTKYMFMVEADNDGNTNCLNCLAVTFERQIRQFLLPRESRKKILPMPQKR
jgi:hypothetical protein